MFSTFSHQNNILSFPKSIAECWTEEKKVYKHNVTFIFPPTDLPKPPPPKKDFFLFSIVILWKCILKAAVLMQLTKKKIRDQSRVPKHVRVTNSDVADTAVWRFKLKYRCVFLSLLRLLFNFWFSHYELCLFIIQLRYRQYLRRHKS